MSQGRPAVLILTPLWKFITRKDHRIGSTVDFYQIYFHLASSVMELQSHAKKILGNWNIHKYVYNKILWSRNTQKYLVTLQRSWRIHVIQNIDALIKTLSSFVYGCEDFFLKELLFWQIWCWSHSWNTPCCPSHLHPVWHHLIKNHCNFLNLWVPQLNRQVANRASAHRVDL